MRYILNCSVVSNANNKNSLLSTFTGSVAVIVLKNETVH